MSPDFKGMVAGSKTNLMVVTAVVQLNFQTTSPKSPLRVMISAQFRGCPNSLIFSDCL